MNYHNKNDCRMEDFVMKKCVFLTAGRLIYRKGQEFLLDTFMKLPCDLDYECRIVGNGPELIRLQKRCNRDESLSKHIVFTGAILYEKMKNEYENADVFIMPSIRETTGAVLLEAMSKGLPVITINAFGGSMLIDENRGWLYSGVNKEDYIENLKNALVECILKPEEVRRRGDNAKKYVRQFSYELKNQYYQEIYIRIKK